MITAVVIQRNHITYAECGGKSQAVHTGDDIEIGGDFWGVPAKDNGIFRGYNITAKNGGSAPTPDSISLVRIHDKVSGDVLHVLGTVADFNAAVEDEASDPMPLATTIPVVVPELYPCDPDDDGDYEYHWPVPSKAGADEYRAHVLVDNVQAVPAASAGHATFTLMVTWLNANYAAAGTWSEDGTRLKLVSATRKKVGVTITVGNYA